MQQLSTDECPLLLHHTVVRDQKSEDESVDFHQFDYFS